MGVSVVVNEDNYIKLKQSAHNNRRTIGNELAMILDKHFEESTTGEFVAQAETRGRWGGATAQTETTTSPKQTAPPNMYNRFVEFRNVDGQLCTQVVSGTETSLGKQFINNKQYKPKWVSELLEQGMPTMQWQIEHEPSDKWVTDSTNSWRSV